MTNALKLSVGDAVERIAVPQFNFQEIARRAVSQPPAREAKKPRARWLALLIIAVPAVAFGAGIAPSPQMRAEVARLFHFQKNVPVTWRVSMPVPPAQAIKDAAFDLRLPSGLPTGSRLVKAYEDGTNGTQYTAEYALANGKHISFTLAKAEAHAAYLPWIYHIDADREGHVVGQPKKIPVRIWISGDEVVTVAATALSATQMQAVERSMHGHDARLMVPAKPRH